MQILFCSGNANKVKEVRAILAAANSSSGNDATAEPIEITSKDVDVPEIQGTTREVAIAKVKAAADKIGGACITEDTALSFDALGGLPGAYIKAFMSTIGHDGINRMLQGFDDKSADAICTFAYCAGPGQEPILFEGKTRGRIVPARGPTHFGWDPIFEVQGTGKTYAEMDGEEKNKLSHRYKALELLRQFLEEQARNSRLSDELNSRQQKCT
ncbi:nucleoside triphosphate pyrophosphohydrolase ham1 [Microbotryomycetes sp. JL201]|nr:nucleoside triphosphate pyrophosphohydrolase ham1 [Microbotryomycetes sp. JL201]